ncbi:heterokaryon incompatibility protein [Colletotrichum truncatum]|uniref:Heterokaryon incompatibility protein n=1 Tax=Colletotrichum truncatum TaxID=5467 RepID=A0ACC3YE29_COLTU
MAWSIMDNWMKTCFESHTQCKLPEISPSYRPTRLIKINSQRTVRLVQGVECPSIIRYVALSYCWGSKPVENLLRLLQSTLEELSREQPVDILPKTFRDAIEVAQHFGVNYIWIDRLCIFQDSPEDWQREASTMQDVYRNALFSIAATGAKDDEGGCFFERDPAKVAPTIVRIKLTEDSEEKAFRFGLEKAWSWRLSFRNEPLVQRSWVVQERLLAPRTLHFGSKQVFWECREASCCEMHPQGVFNFESVFNGDEHPFLWKQLLDAPDRIDVSDPYEQLFSDWKSITNYYVARKLTVASDKLVALSGLANDMKTRLKQLRPGPHRYLAGHWEETLMDTIMWSVGRGEARRALQYRAPSWSWACMDGGLGLMGGCRQGNGVSFATMVSVKTAHSGSEDTGEAVGDILTLAGPCAVVQIDVEQFQPSGYPRYKTEKFVQSIEDDEGNSLYERNETGIKISFDTLEDFVEEALLMWMCSHMYYGGKWYGHGLALSRVEEDRYRRVGLVRRRFNNENDVRKFSIGFSHKQVEII